MNIKSILLMLKFICFNAALLANLNNSSIVLFSHGIADTYKQAFGYAHSYVYNNIKHSNERYLFPCSFATFNYPDATERFWRVNYNETSFGQENEIKRLYSAYEKVQQWSSDKWSEYNIILFGLSRGASNLGIFAGTHLLKNVKAIILESPYYTMGEVISHMLEKNNLGWISLSYGETIAEFIFKRYSRTGASPATTIENISHDIPILIICSKEDNLVPCSSSINVYKKLIKSGHPQVSLLILDHGQHAKILSGKDGYKYQAVVHAFYKKYNLPYDASIAEIGESFLNAMPISFIKK